MRTETRYLVRLAAVALGTLAGCATGTDTTPVRRPAPVTPSPLVSPLEGYPYRVDATTAADLGAAFAALREGGSTELAERTAAALLEQNDRFHPAHVLAAQVDLARKLPQSAVERLLEFAEELPEYTAAQLTLGHAAEEAEDPVTAYVAFRRVAGVSRFAESRARALEPRALQIVHNRFEDDLGKGRLQDALGELVLLEEWAPEDPETLRASMAVASILGDGERELEALRRLTELPGASEDLLRRRGELEIDVGDAGTGVRIFEDLAARYPDDPQRQDDLAAAKFRWRLQVLPAEVSEVGRRPELSRGDFAMLVYWLFPGVRFRTVTSGEIATDVLDHPYRDQIVRVVNLGFMQVDPVLHTFRPEAAIERREVLSSLLLTLEAESPPPACMDRAGRLDGLSMSGVCSLAARCGLIASPDDCLPGAGVSGREALQLVRLAQEQVGSS